MDKRVTLDEVFAHIDAHQERYLADLFPLLRQPSVSATGEGMQVCADLLASSMRALDMAAEILPTGGHPVVFGDTGGTLPFTLLIYGHYDVQPPEPLEAWASPPFAPEIRQGRIYGRGTADNKGQLFTHLKAIQAIRQVMGTLPIRVKLLFEGEEEVGSVHLSSFVREHRALLQADLALGVDGNIHSSGRPEIALGMKGMVYAELIARGPRTDLHCGKDPIVANPAWRLVSALSTIKDGRNRICIEGFHDSVVPPSQEDLALLERVPVDMASLLQTFGVDGFLDGLTGTQALRRLVFDPTCSIDGLSGGYAGPGMKTIIPSTALAKLCLRLVPNQTSDEVLGKLRAHLDRRGFQDIELHALGTFEPSRSTIGGPILDRIVRTVAAVYRQDPLLFPLFSTGGSGPDFVFTRDLGVPSVWIPCAQFKDKNIHAPNENLTVEGFLNGVKTTAALVLALGELYDRP
jgi:acetylornithine deacetylase/succinyl-diaminopimelate desuccinylase-like protein